VPWAVHPWHDPLSLEPVSGPPPPGACSDRLAARIAQGLRIFGALVFGRCLGSDSEGYAHGTHLDSGGGRPVARLGSVNNRLSDLAVDTLSSPSEAAAGCTRG
jgi:hypothetical protein